MRRGLLMVGWCVCALLLGAVVVYGQGNRGESGGGVRAGGFDDLVGRDVTVHFSDAAMGMKMLTGGHAIDGRSVTLVGVFGGMTADGEWLILQRDVRFGTPPGDTQFTEDVLIRKDGVFAVAARAD